MKNNFKILATRAIAVAAVAGMLYACSDQLATDDSNSLINDPSRNGNVSLLATPVGPSTATECTITNITANTTWTPAGNPYILYGDVRVNNNATLTIQAGVVVRGDKASRGTLTIERGAKIIANGTSTNPIVFTSNQPAGSRAPKDWGGINILGRAVNNQGASVNAEGYPACVTAPQYGGTNDADDSGVLRYVRIEFGGIPQASVANSEKNGLTLYSVGSETDIDHIQVSYGGDDAFEWFGGAVNAKYLISYRNQDDDFDSDFGYKGKVQFGIAVRDPAIADNSASNGFESDTDADGVNGTRTTARFSNFTLIGPYDPACARTVVNNPSPDPRFQDGLHLRRNTGIDVYNSIITGWPRNQVFAETTSVVASPAGVQLTHNTAVKPFNVAASLCFTEPVAPNNVWTLSATNLCNNATVCSNLGAGSMIAQSGLSAAAWTLTNPSVRPSSATSAVETNGTNANLLDSFFTANTTSTTVTTTFFRGARRFADDNGWNFTGSWVNYDPQNAPYPN
jgi:hypothetical protein